MFIDHGPPLVLRPSGAECSAGRAVGPLPDSGRSFRPAGAKPFANVISIDMASLRDEGMIVQNRIGARLARVRHCWFDEPTGLPTVSRPVTMHCLFSCRRWLPSPPVFFVSTRMTRHG